LDIYPCHRRLWRLFRKHHYLNDGELHAQSECFVATRNGAPAAFLSLLYAIGVPRTRRISRLVVSPEFQGLGIGRRFAEWAGERCRDRGQSLRISTAHPAMLAALAKSEKWRLARRARCRAHTTFARWTRPTLLGRTLTTFEYQPEA
jgi:GNAT superfamily N-acetyltransferase